MGLFSSFKAKFKTNNSKQHNKADVVCLKYTCFTEFDSNGQQAASSSTINHRINTNQQTKLQTNHTLNTVKKEENNVDKVVKETPPATSTDQVYAEYIDEDTDNYQVHIVHYNEDEDQDQDEYSDNYVELHERPPSSLQFSSQAASIFFGDDDDDDDNDQNETKIESTRNNLNKSKMIDDEFGSSNA